MSTKAQKEKILKLNIKNKKMARLFFSPDLTQKDIIFLNYAYEERQNLHFRYAIVISVLSSTIFAFKFFRQSYSMTRTMGLIGACFCSHFYWSSLIAKRFDSLMEPYFQKYNIK